MGWEGTGIKNQFANTSNSNFKVLNPFQTAQLGLDATITVVTQRIKAITRL